jgi:hypothetical protein
MENAPSGPEVVIIEPYRRWADGSLPDLPEFWWLKSREDLSLKLACLSAVVIFA